MIRQPIRVLLVADTEIDRRAIEGYIAEMELPYILQTTATLAETLERLQDSVYDVILFDYRLAGGPSLKILSYVDDMPAIVIIDRGSEQNAVEAIQQGAYDYLVRDPEGTYLTLLPLTIQTVLAHRKAEIALREGERRYKRIIEAVTDYIYTVKIKDKRPVSTTHGPGCIAVTGYTPEAYQADPYLWYHIIYEADRQAVLRQADQVLTGKGVTPLELRIYHKDGSIRWVKNTPVQRYDQTGQLVAYDGLITDITERKKAEEDLRDSELRYRSLFENSGAGIIILDKQGMYQLINEKAAETLGGTAKDFIGKSLFDLFPKDIAEKYLETNRKIIEAGIRRKYEQTFSLPDGKKTYLIIEQPVKDASGRSIALQSSSIDVTAHKEAEKTLRRRNHELAMLNWASQAFISTLDLGQVLATILEKVRHLLNVMACSIWLIDPETQELVCHQATDPQGEAIRGWRLAPGEGLGGWVVQHKESLLVFDAQTDKRYDKGVSEKTGLSLRSVLSVPLKTKKGVNGVIQVVDSQAGRFTTADLALLEPLAATAAIAIENAQLYEQAQRDTKTKAILLREVNHRVKNNLMAISGLLVAEKRYTQAKRQTAVATAMERLNQRLKGLAEVHNILSQSKWSPVSLPDLANQIIRLALKTQPLGQHIQVKITQSPAEVIEVSPRQANNLALVINELATNSLKYCFLGLKKPEEASITVDLALEDDIIYFEYRDNGPGYPEEILNLERYDMVQPQRPGKAASSVGLYLIQRIVTGTLHGALRLVNDNGAVTNIQFKTEERSTT